MTREELFDIIGGVDEQKVKNAGLAMMQRKKTNWAKWSAMAACLALVIISGFVVNNMLVSRRAGSNEPMDLIGEQRDDGGGGAGTLPGADKIYPTLMVNGSLYAWRRGVAILDNLPENSVYYGEVIHIDGETPANDREFVSAFPATGQIYIVQGNEECVYVVLTTDWFSDRVVIFDLC